jgi:hypothetical protein
MRFATAIFSLFRERGDIVLCRNREATFLRVLPIGTVTGFP